MNDKVLFGYAVVSQLHFLNFLVYYKDNREKYVDCIIFIGVYWEVSIISKEYIDYARGLGVTVYVGSENRDQVINEIRKGGLDLDCVFVNSVSIKIALSLFSGLKLNKIILIDEGISTYASEKHRRRSTIREKGLVWFLSRWTMGLIGQCIFLLFRVEIFRFSIFSEKSLEVNERYKVIFPQILKEIYSSRNKKNYILNPEDKIALLCSQPYVELGLMGEKEYHQQLINLKSKLEQKGLSLIVKKHPVETKINYENLGIPEIIFTGTIEEFIANNPVDCIISQSSTSSLLVSSILNVDSYIFSYSDISGFGGILKNLFVKYCKEIDQI